MDELIDALMNVIELKRERDKAFEDCDATWGYFGYEIEERLEKAKAKFADALKVVILEVVK